MQNIQIYYKILLVAFNKRIKAFEMHHDKTVYKIIKNITFYVSFDSFNVALGSVAPV